jgi:IPT/TIG domain/HYDIN/CFA65/VesB-like, Ig-like domain
MLTNNLRERWQHYLVRRTDQDDIARPDLWRRGIQQLGRMKIVARDVRPAPAGAPAPVVFSGVSWQPIGPQPLRIDAEQNFQGSGPDSGEVVDIAIDPTGGGDQVMYIATNNGGVWKSVDGGATWRPKTDFMPSLSMGAIALDPVDPLIVYAGTGNNFDGGSQNIRNAGIYRSIDGGETWTQLSAAQFVAKQIDRILIPAPGVLLVATNGGLFRSVNAGASFGANSPNFDDGSPVLAGSITDLALDRQSSATVYASVEGQGIFVSTDGGITYPNNLFTVSNGAPTPPFDWISFGQAASDSSVMYALVTDSTAAPPFKGLFRSSDKGTSWTPQPGAAAAAAQNNGLQNAYDVTLGVDPLDSNRVYIGFQEMYRSLDGGLNFGIPAITASQVHFDHHAIVFTPHPPGAPPTPFYVGTDGGLSRNNDGNTNWTNLNETIATNLFYSIDIGRNSPANNQFTYGGCQDTGTSERRPGFAGNDWHEGVNGDGGPVVVDPNNPLRAYGRDGFPPDDSFVVTADGGVTWNFPAAAATGLPNVTRAGSPDSAATPLGVDPLSSAVVYVANGNRIFRSTNTGAAFALMHTFPAAVTRITAFATTKLDSKVLMAGCDDGSVFRTANADAGAASTWVQVTVNGAPTQPVSGVTMDPTDHRIAAITYAGINSIAPGTRTKHVFFSADVTTTAMEDISGTDGGDPDANVPDLPVHSVVFDHSLSPHAVIIGCDIDVLRSTDGGATWHIYGAALPNADCISLAADYALSPPLIRVGTYGRSVFELSRLGGANIFIMSNLAFGDVAQGASSDLTFDIFNIGDATLTITDVSDATANPNFSLQSPPGVPFDIAPGDQVTLTLRFAPAAPGKQIVAYTVKSNSLTQPVIGVPASGSGGFTGPQVTGVLPSTGPAAGGTAVTIHGSGLTGASAVSFGTQAATGLVVDSDTQIHAVTPPGGGVVDVTVVTPGGTTAVNPASHFTYLGATVSVTALNPSQGPSTGGTKVVISGSGLSGATQVLFGAFAASGFTQDSDSQITAISPAGSGVVDILVATISGTSAVNPADQFTYVVPGGGIATGGGVGTTDTTGAGGAPTGDEDVLHALADILRSGTDPDVLEAQRILLRRIALEGNIIDSRIPPPKNITEIGGYVNLLTTLGHTDIRTQMLASVLGVAGPATPVGLSGEGPALAFIPMPNDRPAGDAQATFITAITVRSDMADAFALAMQRIHGFGCLLPFYTPARVLPTATPGQVLQPDLLQILGRVLQVSPGALLADPATDAAAIARLSSDPPDRWQLVVREVDGQARIAPASWVAYQAGDTNVGVTPPASLQLMPVAAILADAGWYSSQPFVAPASAVAQGSLPRLINTSGLLKGQTKLGDELLLLYSQPAVMASALAGWLSWLWNGTAFVPPGPPSSV